MSLLQIAEPGMSSAPHQYRLAVGIDLGTTHSLVARIDAGKPHVLTDEAGHALLPSVVRYLPNGRRQIGYDALAAQTTDPQNTIASVKRMMGRKLQDIAHHETLPYQLIDADGMVRIQTVDGPKTPVEVSAEILATLRYTVEDSIDEPLAGAVITVPAYFDDAQRQATKDAAQLAGIHVLRLLSEPTAAAIAYGLDNGKQGIYAAYDLGGGTFDISILRLNQGVFEVLATGGNSELGGNDFDHCIVQWIKQTAKLGDLTPTDTQTLFTLARQAKERLSTRKQATIACVLSNQQKIHLCLTRKKFEQISKHLVKQTLNHVKNTLHDAQLTVADIEGIILIGGATRMPQIRHQIAKFFGKQAYTGLDPDKIVAIGAAMQANLLAGNRAPGEDWLLLDVIPLSLGIETMGGLVEKIIQRNATIPCTYAQDFTTFKDGQTALAIHVLQGERELVSDCRSLARFELRGIPPMAAGVARIRITFQVDADGLLSVSATETISGTHAEITVKPSYGLTDTEIADMLTQSNQNIASDMQERFIREAQVEAQRTVNATQVALSADGDLLDADERVQIDLALSELMAHLNDTDHELLRKLTETLTTVTEPFAAKRMNRSITQALSGKSIDKII